MKKFIFALISPLLLITSCAPEPRIRKFEPELCSERSSFTAGYNDGNEGRPMEMGYTYSCREDLREASRKGYQDGYDKGKAEYTERMKQFYTTQKKEDANSIPQTTPRDSEKSRPMININIGGNQKINSKDSTTNAKAWYCEVTTFMKTFNAFGPTQLEAKQLTLDSCTKKYHQMHCDNIQCRENR